MEEWSVTVLWYRMTDSDYQILKAMVRLFSISHCGAEFREHSLDENQLRRRTPLTNSFQFNSFHFISAQLTSNV